MTHDAAQHIHEADPNTPVSKWHPYSKWTRTIVARLIELHKTYSARECANRLSVEFGIPFSRGSVIGKLHRLGLTFSDGVPRVRRERQAPRPNRPVLRIIRSNGNSPNLKVTYSIERDLETFSTPVEVPASLNLTLLELNKTSCRYVTQNGPDWRFCGHDQQAGYSYCRFHKPLVWVAPTARNQAARGWK